MDNNKLKIGIFVAIMGALAFGGYYLFEKDEDGSSSDGIIPEVTKKITDAAKKAWDENQQYIEKQSINEVKKAFANNGDLSGEPRAIVDALGNPLDTSKTVAVAVPLAIKALDAEAWLTNNISLAKRKEYKAANDALKAQAKARDDKIAADDALLKKTLENSRTCQEVLHYVTYTFTKNTTVDSPEYKKAVQMWITANDYAKYGYANNDLWYMTHAAFERFANPGQRTSYDKLTPAAQTMYQNAYGLMGTVRSMTPKEKADYDKEEKGRVPVYQFKVDKNGMVISS